MGKLSVAIAFVLVTTPAAAEPAFNMLGFRMTAGALPVDGGRLNVMSLGVEVEHPVFRRTRMFGDYEWLWTTWFDERAVDSVAFRPARIGNGHRASLGLRRELVGKDAGRGAHMFVDGELGANVALTTDSMSRVAMGPGGLLGLRFGYDVYTSHEDSPSRTFEVELVLRAITCAGGTGAMVGLGMLWGN